MDQSQNPCFSILIHYPSQRYTIGLSQKEGLDYQNGSITSINYHCINEFNCVKCNIKTKEMIIGKQEGNELSFQEVNPIDFIPNAVLDINGKGLRWEGSSYKGKPFGYGCIFADTNTVVYKGFMIENQKCCYGKQFYPDSDSIEYCGCFWNNQRHGYGMLFDRSGKLLFEGVFHLGSIPQPCVHIRDNNDDIVHRMIEELIIDERSMNDHDTSISFDGFPNLKRIAVGSHSCNSISSITLSSSDIYVIIHVIFLIYHRFQ